MSLFDIGKWQSVRDVRAQRHREADRGSALSVAATALQQAGAQRVRDNMALFRQVERELQPPARPRVVSEGDSSRREFRPSPSPSGRFVDRFADVAGPFTERTEVLKQPPPPTIRPLSPEQEAQFPALAEALNPPGYLERVGRRALSTVGKGFEEGQEFATKYPIIGGPLAETEGPGTSAQGRFFTRFGDPLAASLRGSVLGGPLSTYVPPEKRPNVAKAWWGSQKEQDKALVVMEEAGWPTAMVLRAIADPSLLLPGVGLMKVRTFTNAIRRAGELTGPARIRAVSALRESETFQAGARTLGEAAQDVRLAPERGGPLGGRGATASEKAAATRNVKRAEKALAEAEQDVAAGNVPDIYPERFRRELEYAQGVKANLDAGVPSAEAYALPSEGGAAPPRQPPPPVEPPAGGPAPSEREGFAGNIRLSKYPEDIADELKRWADENPDAVQAARRGVRSDEQVLADARELAEQTGGDFNKLQRKWKPGEAWNAEEVTAIRGLLRQKTDTVLEAAQAARAADSSANHARLLLAIEEQARVQQIVHGATAEAGRSLRAFRQEAFDAIEATDTRRLEELLRRTGMDKGRVDALADRVASLDLANPAEVNNFLRSVNKPDVGDYIMEFWINSILSGPKTHIINALSNTAFAATSAIERGLAAVVDVPLARLQGRQVARFFQEVPAGAFGAISGIDEGVRAALRTFRDGITPAQASKWEFRRTAFPGVAGRVIRLPGTALEAADSLFYSINYRAELNSLIVRQARSERLTGAKLVERIADLKLNPTEKLIKQASQSAEYRLFRQEPGKIVQRIMAAREAVPGGRFVLPFLRTPGNLLAAGLERTPFGLLNPSLWRNLAAKSPEASDQIARLLLGSGVAAGLGAMVANGTIDITGAAPTNLAARDRFFREGKQAFAVKIGGMWIQYRRLEPFNQPLAQLSSFVEAVRSGDAPSADKIAAQMITTLGNQFVSQTYLSGLSGFLDAIADPKKAGSRWATRTATGFTPFSSALRTIAQLIDPTFRDPETPLEQFETGIPGLSQRVPPRLTAFGEEAGRESPAVSPIQVTPAQQSALDAELERLDVEVGFTGRSIGGYKLDREQQFAYQRAAGQMTYLLLAEFTDSEDYQTLSDGEKAKLIELAIQEARDEVRDPINEMLDFDEFQELEPAQQNQIIDALLEPAGVR